ncbi:MAG TPA: M23 family metallopeptidase [Candidatus Krumholzibacteriaceae bacterium]|nr:M23 family metallopeptidase [Candidatus Krumholzibacteriaceae bacterium]
MNKLSTNKLLAGTLVVLAAVLLFSLAVLFDREKPEEEIVSSGLEEPPPGENHHQQPVTPKTPTPSFQGVVGKNMNFFDLMRKCDISPQMINRIVKASSDVYNLRRIYPGQSYRIFSGSGGNTKRFEFSINDEEFLEVTTGNDTVKARRIYCPFKIHKKSVSGIIRNSLYESISRNDIPFELASNINNIFRWDIDFFHDIRPDDYYRLVYEEKEIINPFHNKPIRKINRILAAEFNCSGKKHYAFLFNNKGDKYPDYFNEEGNSLRKQLLKAPLNFTRISSSYSKSRFHPILHHYMPHNGIDYAAPTGTPVQASGNGTVIKASRTRANGNYIKIRHNRNYTSYYLHLSKFARGIKYGVKVKQGDVIGYVGATGYATGPHLDYRIKKNGHFIDPRKLKLPPAEPVDRSIMDRFELVKNSYLSKLNKIAVGTTVSKEQSASIGQADLEKKAESGRNISQHHSSVTR